MVIRKIKSFVKRIIIFLAVALILFFVFYSERKENERNWNNGKCPKCNTAWEFSNASVHRGTTYVWYCPNCKNVIFLSEQVTK